MRFFNKNKTSHIVVGSNGEGFFSDGRDFAKERKERQVKAGVEAFESLH